MNLSHKSSLVKWISQLKTYVIKEDNQNLFCYQNLSVHQSIAEVLPAMKRFGVRTEATQIQIQFKTFITPQFQFDSVHRRFN